MTTDESRIQAILIQLTETNVRFNVEAMNCVDFAHIIYLRFFTFARCSILQSADHVVCSVNDILLDPMSNARITNFNWYKDGIPLESQCKRIDTSQPIHKLNLYYTNPAIKSYTLTKNYT